MAKFSDITGMKLGKLTVISRAPDHILPSGYKQVMWNCLCECGNTSVVSRKNLFNNRYPTRSCGCEMNKIKKGLTGKKFGRLLVKERIQGKILKSGYAQITYKCLCDCGNFINVPYNSLVSGNTSSCGCLFAERLIERNSTHKKSNTKLYEVWKSMKQRCSNENNKSYQYYGGKGITVCPEWIDDYDSFYLWAIGNGYEEGLEIDRIDGNGNYEPDNCRWTTRKVQMNNVSNNRIIEIDTYKYTLSEWSRLFSINEETLRNRVEAGWELKTALTAPIGYRYKKKGKLKDGEELFSRVVRC